MKTTQRLRMIESESGLATIETLPMLFIFIFLISYMFGSFGVIHTGIMHSIAARAYAFETFRNRSNLVYFRDIPVATSDLRQYKNIGSRHHAVLSEQNRVGDGFEVTERPIRIGMTTEPAQSHKDPEIHNKKVYEMERGKRNSTVDVSPAWIMVQYGICMDAKCGDD